MIYLINYMIIILSLLFLLGRGCLSNEYYNGTTLQCVACASKCQACTGPTSCSTCNPGYYMREYTCSSCLSTCATCTTATTCTTCNNGFYLNSNSSTCQLCYSNCLSCAQSSCTKCNSGLYPNGQECLTCKVSCDCSDGTLQNCPILTSALLIAIIMAPILFVTSIILIYCFVNKKCKKRQQNSHPPQESNTDNSTSIGFGLRLIGVMLNMKKNNWTVNQNGGTIDQNEICSICLHKNTNLETKCKHQFHIKCLCLWIKEKATCPLCKSYCKKQLRKYCKNCCKNYIMCDIKSVFKYNVSFFDICPYCQSVNQTQEFLI